MIRGRVVSIQVGQPHAVEHAGRMEYTAIFKQRVEGPVHLGALGFSGDTPGDTLRHGGPNQAAYAYPREHYAHWAMRLPSRIDEPGLFGENLTTAGLLETDVCHGDILRLGAARVQVTTPRVPCFKLGIRTGDPTIMAPLLASGRLGFYLRVLEEGPVQAGDPIELDAADPDGLRMSDLIAALFAPGAPAELIGRALAIATLPPQHRARLIARQNDRS
jgi:MOSC domain-containing protein YiiM